MIWALGFSSGLLVRIFVITDFIGLFFFINSFSLFFLNIGGLLLMFKTVIWMFIEVLRGVGLFRFIVRVRRLYTVIFFRFNRRWVRITLDVGLM